MNQGQNTDGGVNPFPTVPQRVLGTDDQEDRETTTSPTPVLRKQTLEEIDRDGFTSTIPFDSTSADCVVICCSDHRFEEQEEEFVHALGFDHPYFIQVPSGVAVFTALVAAAGFLPKGMTALLSKAVELTGTSNVICIGHEDCGGYKAGQNKVVQFAARHLANKSIPEIQREHLAKGGKAISRSLGSDVTVRTYYADIVNNRNGERVHFSLVETWNARSSRRT